MGVKEPRSGLVMGAAAYFLWGLVPLFWPLLAPASSAEALAHRFVWSMVLVLLLLVVTRRLGHFRAIWTDARRVGFLFVASVVIALNWGGFIWGVNHGHVIEVSLGYFINPLVTVMLGVFVLGENLRRWQWAAVGVGAVAVAVLTIDHGRPPWIALLLAGSFATYGFLKKQARLGALESLGAETLMLTPVALAFLLWLEATGRGTFGHAGRPTSRCSSAPASSRPFRSCCSAVQRRDSRCQRSASCSTSDPPSSSCSACSSSRSR